MPTPVQVAELVGQVAAQKDELAAVVAAAQTKDHENERLWNQVKQVRGREGIVVVPTCENHSRTCLAAVGCKRRTWKGQGRGSAAERGCFLS